MLSELLNLLLDIRATETKEILFPIFMNRNRVLWGDDGRIPGFLELLCDERSPILRPVRSFRHNFKNKMSNLGGSLNTLVKLCDGKPLRPRVKFELIARSIQSEWDAITAKLKAADRFIEPAPTEIFCSYVDTEYHREAAKILRDRISETIQHESKQEQRFNPMVQSRLGQLNPNAEPYVTPLIELLALVSPESPTMDLAKETIVLELLSLCSTNPEPSSNNLSSQGRQTTEGS
jgi:hypothetical protein